jgi:hypothetical protein
VSIWEFSSGNETFPPCDSFQKLQQGPTTKLTKKPRAQTHPQAGRHPDFQNAIALPQKVPSPFALASTLLTST